MNTINTYIHTLLWAKIPANTNTLAASLIKQPALGAHSRLGGSCEPPAARTDTRLLKNDICINLTGLARPHGNLALSL